MLELLVLIALPLLSSAALMGGSGQATWPELVVAPVWVMGLLAGRSAWARAGRGFWPGFGLYIAGIAAGVAIVLMSEHRLGSAVFAANLMDAATRWFGPWAATDPLFILRSAVIYAAGPLFFLAVRSVWGDDREPQLLEDLVMWGAAAAAFVALCQAFTGRGLLYEGIPGAAPIGRAPGLLPDPNALASYLALAAAFGVVIWLDRLETARAADNKRLALMAAVWAALLSAGIWVSGSRAAPIALGSVLILAALVQRMHRRSDSDGRSRIVLTAISVAVLVAALVSVATVQRIGSVAEQSRWHRMLSAFDLSQPSMTLLRGRPALWAAGATMILDEPVVGMGAGRFGATAAARMRPGTWGAATAENAHNYYLQVAAEIGIVGLSGLLLMLAGIFAALWRYRERTRARAAFYGAAAWAITGLVGHPQLIPSLQLFFWGFLGMASAGLRLPRIGARSGLFSVLVLLLAARVGQQVIVGEQGRAFYAAGLHEPEPPAPGQELLRWTSRRTDIELRREGQVLDVRFFVAHEQPVNVGVVAGRWTEQRRFFQPGWKTLHYYLPSGGTSAVPISLETVPSLRVPNDARELGVMLAPLRWHRGPLIEPVGTYPAEIDADGRRFYWTAGVACLPLDTSEGIDIELRADNPDLRLDPLTVTLFRGDAAAREVSLSDRDWQLVSVPASPDRADVLCVQVGRTWNPHADLGTGDMRDLGVAIALGAADPQQ